MSEVERTDAGGPIRSLLLGTLLLLAGCTAMQPPAPQPPLTASQDMAQTIQHDQMMVGRGLSPPVILQYDQQMAQMIPEGEAIVAAHDQARAQAWQARFNALMNAKTQAMAQNAAELKAIIGTPHVDPCISPMGKNLCAPPPPQEPQRWCQYSATGNTTMMMPCN